MAIGVSSFCLCSKKHLAPGATAVVLVVLRRAVWVRDEVLWGKIPPPHIEKEICDALFAYKNRAVFLEVGHQATQLRPRLDLICYAVSSRFQLLSVMLKMEGFPPPASTTVRISSLLARDLRSQIMLHITSLFWYEEGGFFFLIRDSSSSILYLIFCFHTSRSWSSS